MRKAVLSCLPARRFAALEPGLREYAGGLIEHLAAAPDMRLSEDTARYAPTLVLHGIERLLVEPRPAR